MKILQIGKYYPPFFNGGIETFSKILHEGMRKRNVNADFLGFLPPSYANDIVLDEHIYLCKSNIKLYSTVFSINFIKRWLRIKDNYEIIFVSMPNPFSALIMELFPAKKAKIVLWWHSDIVKQKRLLLLYRPLLIHFIKKAVAVFAPFDVHVESSDFAKYLSPKKRLVLFPMEKEVKRYPYTLKNGKHVIFSCGRLVYYKGLNVLIDAASYFPDNCIIHIAGDGELYKQLEKQIRNKKLETKVVLLGHISNERLERELRDCFLFCLPSISRAEMWGAVQVEAFCHGKPVISTKIPRSGVAEVSKDGECGFTVEINNPMQIAERINYLIDNKNIYDKFCDAAISRANELTDNKIIDRYIELFSEL